MKILWWDDENLNDMKIFWWDDGNLHDMMDWGDKKVRELKLFTPRILVAPLKHCKLLLYLFLLLLLLLHHWNRVFFRFNNCQTKLVFVAPLKHCFFLFNLLHHWNREGEIFRLFLNFIWCTTETGWFGLVCFWKLVQHWHREIIVNSYVVYS